MRNLIQKKITGAALALLLITAPKIYAQYNPNQKVDTSFVSPEVVVSSTRVPQTIEQTGRNITVISQQEIQQLPVHSVDELLRYIPGVEVQSRNGFGTQSDFSIRGSTFSQVLVLIDGLKLNDPLTGHFDSNIPISPAEIQRIEVLRGPAAAMYGADAMGGVIQIITKTFANKTSDQTSLSSSINYGQNQLIDSHSGFFYKKGNIRTGGGYLINESPGQELGSGTKNYFDNRTLSGSFGYHFSKKWDVVGRTAYDYHNFNAKYFYTSSPYDKATEQTRGWWNQLRVRHLNTNGYTDLDLGFKRNIDHYVFNPAFPPANHHITKFWDMQVNHYQRYSHVFSLNSGVQADNRNIVSNDRGIHNDWHGGIYAVGFFQPISQLSLTTSFRGDYDQNYGFELLPQLNASYGSGKWIFRAAAGRSIRAADFTERYISNNLPGPLSPGRNIGNPNLKAEQAWSAEAGFDVFPVSGLKFVTTLFTRRSSNLIDYVMTNAANIQNNGNLQPNADYLYAENIKSVNTTGLEMEGWLSQRLDNNWNLQYEIGYTYLYSKSAKGVISKYVSNHAGNMISTNLILNNRRFDLGINGLWKQRNPEFSQSINSGMSNEYMVWNIKAGYKIYRNISFNVQVENLLNAQYQDILGAKMPNRWMMAGFSWNM